MAASSSFDGRCDCGLVRYRMLEKPMFVHCCHCRWCQREAGSAFALNAVIETSKVEILTSTTPEITVLPSESGKGQAAARCPQCKVVVWSNYGGTIDVMRSVKVGTLNDPDQFPPDVHIYTSTKQPWLKLEEGTPAFAEYYDRYKFWPKDSLERRERLDPLFEAARRKQNESR